MLACVLVLFFQFIAFKFTIEHVNENIKKKIKRNNEI